MLREQPLKMRYVKDAVPLRSRQFGVIYKAINIDLGKFIAVKIMQQPARKLEQEE
jgi:hypothetical protein